jgi:hypothetical protein
MKTKRGHAGENNPFFGKRHTEETRRKMSEAAKRRKRQGSNVASNIAGCYRLLIAAIVKQAVKDKAVRFFETETGKDYCAVAGVNPAKLIGGRP